MTTTIRHIVTGDGPPMLVPPGIGAHYVDTLTGQQYLAKGSTLVSDWIKVQEFPDGGLIGEVLTLTPDGPRWENVTESPGAISSVDVVIRYYPTPEKL